MLAGLVACSFCKTVCQYSLETSSFPEEFGYGVLWHRVNSGVQTETARILSHVFPWFLCPEGSMVVVVRSLLGQEFEQKWWSYLCSQAFQHSWETCSILVVIVYMESCGTG